MEHGSGGPGVNSVTAGMTADPSGFTFNDTLSMLFLDIFVYSALTWYLGMKLFFSYFALTWCLGVMPLFSPGAYARRSTLAVFSNDVNIRSALIYGPPRSSGAE